MQIILYGSIACRHPLGLDQVIDWAKRFGWDGVDARGMNLDVVGDVGKPFSCFGQKAGYNGGNGFWEQHFSEG